MNLLHLQYFYEVARNQSFTVASRKLRISQPAISKMVKLLEEDLGQVLLERSRSGLQLTERGELLFESASRIFAEASRAEEQQRSSTPQITGEWTLGASDNLAVYVLPKVLGAFKAKNPKLRVSLFAATSAQIKEELRYDRCRLGIFFTSPKPSEPFESRMIHETEFWIVLSRKNSWFPAGKKISLADLKSKSVPRIESRHTDYSSGFPAHFHSKQLGLHGMPWLEVNQHEIKKRLVLEGFGFALLTRYTVEREVASGELVRIESPKRLRAPIFAVWKKGRPLGTASSRFLSDLEEHFHAGR